MHQHLVSVIDHSKSNKCHSESSRCHSESSRCHSKVVDVIPNRFSGEEPAFLRALRSICANSAVKIFNLPSGAPMSHLRTADVDPSSPCHSEPLQRLGPCFYAKTMLLAFF